MPEAVRLFRRLVMAVDTRTHEDHHTLLRVIAALYPVPARRRRSAGSACTFCRATIIIGARQYEIKIGDCTVVADARCYKSFLEEIVAPPDG
jgi:hypothetical protein